ncbi:MULTISPECIES: hypothetical protein [Mycolicibacterium]|uniref:hypothetical protein n=1 Tax=Mycolicibacterium TaxID=1866885 RepID=UPI000848BDBD|nr:hypothetical protein [Mycolicibacterium porcinum]ODR25332.1 hypothetical protein BHQ19_12745 [Mycolicibacterium porcinum]
MEDAIYRWSEEVTNSANDADSLGDDISDLRHHLDDLVHTIKDLSTVRFNDDTEDYEILSKAQDLWNLVSGSVSQIRRSIGDSINEVNDLRRAVDFYRR